MGKYARDRPIILYSKIDDFPDTDERTVGIKDDSIIEEVKVIITRPRGDRWGVIAPIQEVISGFGKWWIAIVNLKFTDEFGAYTARWVFKTNNGNIENEYIIDVVPDLLTPYWIFQPSRDDSKSEGDDEIPDDIKIQLDGILVNK